MATLHTPPAVTSVDIVVRPARDPMDELRDKVERCADREKQPDPNPEGRYHRIVSSVAELPRVLELLQEKPNLRIEFQLDAPTGTSQAERQVDLDLAREFILTKLPKDLSKAHEELANFLRTHPEAFTNHPVAGITMDDVLAINTAIMTTRRGSGAPERQISKDIPIDLSGPSSQIVGPDALGDDGKKLLEAIRYSKDPDAAHNPATVTVKLPETEPERKAALEQIGSALKLADTTLEATGANKPAILSNTTFVSGAFNVAEQKYAVTHNDAWGATDDEGIRGGIKKRHAAIELANSAGKKTAGFLAANQLTAEDERDLDTVKGAVREKLLGDANGGLLAISTPTDFKQYFAPAAADPAVDDAPKIRAFTEARAALASAAATGATSSETEVKEKLAALDKALEELGVAATDPLRVPVRKLHGRAEELERIAALPAFPGFNAADAARAHGALVTLVGGTNDLVEKTGTVDDLKAHARTRGSEKPDAVTDDTHRAYRESLDRLRTLLANPIATDKDCAKIAKALEDFTTACDAVGIGDKTDLGKQLRAVRTSLTLTQQGPDLHARVAELLGAPAGDGLLGSVTDRDTMTAKLFGGTAPAAFTDQKLGELRDAARRLETVAAGGDVAATGDALRTLCEEFSDVGVLPSNPIFRAASALRARFDNHTRAASTVESLQPKPEVLAMTQVRAAVSSQTSNPADHAALVGAIRELSGPDAAPVLRRIDGDKTLAALRPAGASAPLGTAEVSNVVTAIGELHAATGTTPLATPELKQRLTALLGALKAAGVDDADPVLARVTKLDTAASTIAADEKRAAELAAFAPRVDKTLELARKKLAPGKLTDDAFADEVRALVGTVDGGLTALDSPTMVAALQSKLRRRALIADPQDDKFTNFTGKLGELNTALADSGKSTADRVAALQGVEKALEDLGFRENEQPRSMTRALIARGTPKPATAEKKKPATEPAAPQYAASAEELNLAADELVKKLAPVVAGMTRAAGTPGSAEHTLHHAEVDAKDWLERFKAQIAPGGDRTKVGENFGKVLNELCQALNRAHDRKDWPHSEALIDLLDTKVGKDSRKTEPPLTRFLGSARIEALTKLAEDADFGTMADHDFLRTHLSELQEVVDDKNRDATLPEVVENLAAAAAFLVKHNRQDEADKLLGFVTTLMTESPSDRSAFRPLISHAPGKQHTGHLENGVVTRISAAGSADQLTEQDLRGMDLLGKKPSDLVGKDLVVVRLVTQPPVEVVLEASRLSSVRLHEDTNDPVLFDSRTSTPPAPVKAGDTVVVARDWSENVDIRHQKGRFARTSEYLGSHPAVKVTEPVRQPDTVAENRDFLAATSFLRPSGRELVEIVSVEPGGRDGLYRIGYRKLNGRTNSYIELPAQGIGIPSGEIFVAKDGSISSTDTKNPAGIQDFGDLRTGTRYMVLKHRNGEPGRRGLPSAMLVNDDLVKGLPQAASPDMPVAERMLAPAREGFDENIEALVRARDALSARGDGDFWVLFTPGQLAIERTVETRSVRGGSQEVRGFNVSWPLDGTSDMSTPYFVPESLVRVAEELYVPRDRKPSIATPAPRQPAFVVGEAPRMFGLDEQVGDPNGAPLLMRFRKVVDGGGEHYEVERAYPITPNLLAQLALIGQAETQPEPAPALLPRGTSGGDKGTKRAEASIVTTALGTELDLGVEGRKLLDGRWEIGRLRTLNIDESADSLMLSVSTEKGETRKSAEGGLPRRAAAQLAGEYTLDADNRALTGTATVERVEKKHDGLELSKKKLQGHQVDVLFRMEGEVIAEILILRNTARAPAAANA